MKKQRRTPGPKWRKLIIVRRMFNYEDEGEGDMDNGIGIGCGGADKDK